MGNALENDASSAGVRLGGLYNTAEIKILVCYILNAVKEPVPITMLVNELHFQGLANGFEVSDAVVSLTKSGHIVMVDKKDDTYTITEKGTEVAQTLNSSLSYTVKDRAFAITLKLLSKFKNAKQTSFEVIRENNFPYLISTVLDGDIPLMSIKLLLADEGQASSIKERFLDNSTEIYQTVIEKLTK